VSDCGKYPVPTNRPVDCDGYKRHGQGRTNYEKSLMDAISWVVPTIPDAMSLDATVVPVRDLANLGWSAGSLTPGPAVGQEIVES
jgi:hypothetical protein